LKGVLRLTGTVIASELKQSSVRSTACRIEALRRRDGLPRRFSPRNDESALLIRGKL
jgi:hypothetical protein